MQICLFFRENFGIFTPRRLKLSQTVLFWQPDQPLVISIANCALIGTLDRCQCSHLTEME